MQKKKSCKIKKKNCFKEFVKISKRNLKLVNQKIKQLEHNLIRKAVINIAEKCAMKNKSMISSKKFVNYCIKRFNNIMGINSIPISIEIGSITNAMEMYVQMFYNLSSDDENFSDIKESDQARKDEVCVDLEIKKPASNKKKHGDDKLVKKIPLLGGFNDKDLMKEETQEKTVFGIACHFS